MNPKHCIPLLEDLKQNRSVIFTKFGDGEHLACTQSQGRNVDNDSYHSELGQRTRDAFVYFTTRPYTYLGKWHHDPVFNYFETLVPLTVSIPWVNYHWLIPEHAPDCFERHDIVQLIDFIQKTPALKIVVTNARSIDKMCKFLCAKERVVVANNSWSYQFEQILQELLSKIPVDEPSIINISAGLASKALIAEASKVRPLASFLDWGSSLDILTRYENSRGWRFTFSDAYQLFKPVWNLDP